MATDWQEAARRTATWLLRQQDDQGAIPDALGSDRCNEDSNLVYALAGIAAWYEHSQDDAYLSGLEKGLEWLAARQETSGEWRGSWRYAYHAEPPYAPVAVPPGDDYVDARGVSATCGLFAWVVSRFAAASPARAARFEPHVRAALDFALQRNLGPRGFFSSWLQKSDDTFARSPVCYSPDQADMFLGLQGAGHLYAEPRYLDVARTLQTNIPNWYFDVKRYRLGLQIDDAGEAVLPAPDAWEGIFPQGYVSWVFPSSTASEKALAWLSRRQQPDGSFKCWSQDPHYSLTAVIHAMACASQGSPDPQESLQWLLDEAIKPDGSVVDSLLGEDGDTRFSNVAGFAILALLGERGPAPV